MVNLLLLWKICFCGGDLGSQGGGGELPYIGIRDVPFFEGTFSAGKFN